jgi:hypothetical protein
MSIGGSSDGEGDRLAALRPTQSPGPRRSGNRPTLGDPLGDLPPGEAKARGWTADRRPSTGGGSTIYGGPHTVYRGPFPHRLSAALSMALQPVLARLEALETGLVRHAPDMPPSTVPGGTIDGPPLHNDTSTVHPATSAPQTWELRQLKHSERWTIYVPRAMREEVKRRAAARGQHPSLLVQEALGRWLAEEHAS